MDSGYKKKFGRFYTPKDIANLMVKKISVKTDTKILEPGFGKGVFINALIENCPAMQQTNLFAIDSDKKHFSSLKSQFPEIKIRLDSFLHEAVYSENFLYH